MGTSLGDLVQPTLQANWGLIVSDPDTIRCESCGLNQFDKEGRDACIRCKKPLKRPLPPAPAADPEPEPPPREEGITGRPAGSRADRAIGQRIGLRYKVIREYKAIPQSAMGLHVGCPRTYFSKVENGKAVPTMRQLQRLCDGLGITVHDLVDESIPEKEIAVSTMGQGGPDQELIAGLLEAMPKLTKQHRKILLSAAHSLNRKRQMTLTDWVNV